MVNIKNPSPDKTYTRNEFATIARSKGWTVDKSRGKGGHWWFTKNGEAPFPVPEIIKKWLGIK